MDLFGNEIKEKESISREALAEQIYNVLRLLSLDEFVGLMTNRFEEIIEYARLTSGEKSCQKTSLLYNAHRLDTRTKSSAKSLFEAIKTESFCNGLARAVLFKKDKVKELLYQVLQLGINGVQYVNEFPPHVAVKLYKKYLLDENSRILDPCAGWGGRMIGASVISNHYDCFEPCSRTYDGLKRLYADFLLLMRADLDYKLYFVPFEDGKIAENSYDFALTSPPYYDTEIYTDEYSNSLNRYKTFSAWTDYFYLPLVQKTMTALKKDKYFVLNIGSRVYPLNTILIENFKHFEIKKIGNHLSGDAGLGKEGEGEMFYSIRK